MLVIIRGAGDLASGIALRLWHSGIQVVMTDLAAPLAIRRSVAFCEAIRSGEVTVEDIPMTDEEARTQRDKLLSETDWTQVLDAPIDADTREAYRAYRQALRDIPEQEGFPETITWPELPSVTKADPDPVDTAVDTMLGGETA